jgi:transposase
VAHTILVIAYRLLQRADLYHDLGPTYFYEPDRHAVQRRLQQRLERLGYRVVLESLTSAA